MALVGGINKRMMKMQCCGNLSPQAHYPSMTRYPSPEAQKAVQGSEAKAVFRVLGMTCAACAASIEKAIKRLPGIRDALVDVLNNKAHVFYFPPLVNEKRIRESIEDAGFKAESIEEESNESSSEICRIHIKGMTCTSCSSTIESALQGIHGVHKAQVALATEEAQIHYDPKIVSHEQLLQAIEDTGFETLLISTGEHISKIELKIDGIKNEQSIRAIERSLEALPGVENIDIYPDINKVSIAYKPYLTGPRTFIEVIESSGSGCFRAMIYPEERGRESHRQQEIKQYFKFLIWSLAFTIPVFLTSMVLMYIPGIKNFLDIKVVNMLNIGMILRWEFSTPVQFIIGRRFYVGSYKALRKGSANMDVLIALGTNAAYFYSVYVVARAGFSRDFKGNDFFETSSMLISFILLGKYLEVLAKGNTSQAIAKLMELTPDTAILLTLDHDHDQGNVVAEREIDSRLIQKDDVIKVVPGAKVACDGFVIWGQSHVNESMITGESRPAAKRKGDMVIGGTMNENGVLHVKVTRVGSESALSQIVRLVESAQMAKAPVQKLADHISKYFVPLVILLSLSTWFSWFLAGQFHAYSKSWIPSSMNSFELSLQFGICVMVIACPCALGLATPTAVMVGTGVGATQGVLIKGGQALENAHKVNCIVFDKTGTLTLGKPVVVNTQLVQRMALQDFYEFVAAAEVNSEHPIAKAIVEHAKKFKEDEQNPSWPDARDFVSISGHGVKAIVQNKEIMVGNKKLMLDHNIAISVEAAEILAEVEGIAHTGILVSIDREIAGVLAVSDSLKAGANEVVSVLKSMKIRTIMVTGDNWGTANSRQVGIETVIAQAQPEAKANKVNDVQIWQLLSETFCQRWLERYGEEEESKDMASSISDIWQQWNVRGLIILSFSFQCFLIIFAPLKKSTGRITYWSLWVVYILASSAASYCIGLISNKNQVEQGSIATSLDVMAFWAAFLLVHLGGPDNITAFSMEDNDMWQRQFLTLLFQIVTILYIFYETLSDNPLWLPFVLVFLAGMIKCGERISALYSASTDTFREFVVGNPPDIEKIRSSKTDNEGPILSDLQVVRHGYDFFHIFKGLIVDMKYSLNYRKETHDYFSSRTAEDALKVLEVELNFIYDVFYTKVWILRCRLGYFFRFVAFALVISALGVFISYDKSDFNKIDLVLTYVLLYGAVALDFLYLYMFFHSEWNVVFLEKFSKESSRLFVRIFPTKLYLGVLKIFFGFKRLKWSRCKKKPYTNFMVLSRLAVFSTWPQYVSGYNLITHCLGRRDNIMELRSALYRFISHFGDRKLLRLYVVRNPFLKEFWEFIFLEIKRKSQDSSRNSINLEHIHGLLQPHIGTKKYTFEEMIILCHITTDLCYSHEHDADGDGDQRRHFSRLLSEYLMYLLIMDPGTLQAVSVNGRIRFQNTCDSVKEYFFSEWRSLSISKGSSKKEFFEGFLHSDRNRDRSNDSSLWFDARNLANKLNDSPQRWEIMSQVWVELLTFAASTCSALSLVKRLSKGAELISFVWLLMIHLGLGSQFHAGDDEGNDP